jgi:hypothetical protein
MFNSGAPLTGYDEHGSVSGQNVNNWKIPGKVQECRRCRREVADDRRTGDNQ